MGITHRDVTVCTAVSVSSCIILFFVICTGILVYLLHVKSKVQRRIQSLMYQDTLTGADNLTKFRMEAKERLKDCEAGSYAVVYTDISQFRNINDVFGFEEGDRLLQRYAGTLMGILGQGEYCARVSADQFVLLLRYRGLEVMEARAEAVDRKMNLEADADSKSYQLAFVFGVYVVEDKYKGDISRMIDMANYARKSIHMPRKTVTVLYDGEMRRKELHQRHLMEIAGPALENGEFIIYFQPKVDMITGKCVGSEALVRWLRPDGTMISPGDFIPYLEESGYVVELDFYIFKRVCKTVRRWMDQGIPVRTVSCNFSRLHFNKMDFAERLARITDRYRVPRAYLDIEILESIMMDDMNMLVEQFNALKRLGFCVSIDDFGTGYSSLGMLQKLPVDVLKLDRRFLETGLSEQRQRVIIEGVIGIAGKLDMEVICEGVECWEQAEALVKMGARIAQGFYYAKPMPEETFRAFLLTSV